MKSKNMGPEDSEENPNSPPLPSSALGLDDNYNYKNGWSVGDGSTIYFLTVHLRDDVSREFCENLVRDFVITSTTNRCYFASRKRKAPEHTIFTR